MASRYDKRGAIDHRQKRNITKASNGRPQTPKPDYNKPVDPYIDYGMPVIPRPDYTVKIKNPINKVPITRIEDLYAVPNKKKNVNRPNLQHKPSTSSNGSLDPEFLNKLEKKLGAHDEKLNANKRGQLVFTPTRKSPNQLQSSSESSHRGRDYRYGHQEARPFHEYDDPHYDMRYGHHPEDDVNRHRGSIEEKRQYFEQSIAQNYDYGQDEYQRNHLNNGYIAENYPNHQYAEQDIRYQELSPDELGFQNLTIDGYEHPPFEDEYNYQGYPNEYNHHEYYIDEYGNPYPPANEYGGNNMVMKNIR